ncbi:hypothetical protein JCM8097_006597 [Rhodosporidiobolus ruineniae]
MLDRLAPELICTILRAVPYSPAPWPDCNNEDKERRQLYSSLSLVCRSVGAQAQRLLWHDVVAVTPAQAATVVQAVEAAPQLAVSVRSLRLVSDVSLRAAMPVLAQFRNLRKLQSWTNGVVWSDLEELPLEVLDLSDQRIELPTMLKPLNLVRLHLGFVALPRADLEHLLQPAALLALRVLEIESCQAPDGQDTYFPTLSPALISQLDLLLHPLNEFAGSVPPLTVALATFGVMGPRFGLLNIHASHLRILGPGPSHHQSAEYADWASWLDYMLLPLRMWVRSAPEPQTLHLPRAVHALQTTHGAERNCQWPRVGPMLLKECEARGVRVVWHDASGTASAFPEEFWEEVKRVKEEKKLREAEQ